MTSSIALRMKFYTHFRTLWEPCHVIGTRQEIPSLFKLLTSQKAIETGRFRILEPDFTAQVSSQPRYDHFDTSPDKKKDTTF